MSDMGGLVAETLAQIGAQLRHARIAAGLSQLDVANSAGVSRQLVGRIENGSNGEISAYIAVANTLNHRVGVTKEIELNESELAARDLLNSLQAGGQP